MTNESRTIWFMRKGASLQCKWQIFPTDCDGNKVKINNYHKLPSLHLHNLPPLHACTLCVYSKGQCLRVCKNKSTKSQPLCYVTLSGFVCRATLTERAIPAGVSCHTHAEKHQSLSFNRKLMPSLLLKDLNLWQVHEHILNQAGQMKLEGSSWKPHTGSCQFALMPSNAMTKAHAKQPLWISMICKGYK